MQNLNYSYSHSAPNRFSQTSANYLWLAVAVTFGTLALTLTFFAAFTGLPIQLGFNIPMQDTGSDYIWAMLLSIILTGGIVLLPLQSSERSALIAVWCAKCLVGLYFMLYFETQYFSLDAYNYFQAARDGSGDFSDYTFGAGTELICIISTWLYDLFPGGYHTLKQFFSFIGLIAIYLAYRGFSDLMGRASPLLLLFLGLFPSLLFWTSAIGKEPIVMLAIGAFIFCAAKTQLRPSLFFMGAMLVSVFVAASVRLWLGVILCIPLIFIAFFSTRSFTYRALVVILSLAVTVGFTIELADRFDIVSQQEAFERLDTASRGWSEDGGSGQQIASDITDLQSFIAFLPVAVFSALYRPLPGEIDSIFGFLSGLENAFFIFLTLRALARANLQKLLNPSILAGVFFVGSWLILYSTVAYQNLGTAVRFKVQIIPVLLALLLYFGASNSIPIGKSVSARRWQSRLSFILGRH